MFLAENSTLLSGSRVSAGDPLERMLKRIRRSDEFPAISRYLIEINQKLSSNPDSSDASELATVILKDYGLTNKLLKLVNSAYYGFAAGKVTTVTRAVVVLGYEHIRLATISLALFEHFKNKSNASDLKEAVISSLWSGMLARDIADMDGGIDPEEAFVCALMGQLGKLVMIYYLPDEYSRACQWRQVHGEPESKAVRSACGITYETLGMAVADQWNFPRQICQSMQVLSREDLQDKARRPSRLRALSSFVKELGDAIGQGGLSVNGRTFRDLLERYAPIIKISRRHLKTLLRDSAGKVNQHAHALSFSIENSSFMRSLASVFQPEGEKAPGSNDSGWDGLVPASFQLTDGADLKSGPDETVGQNPKDIIMEGIQEISEAMMADHNVNDIALMSLEVLYRALGFHCALMFIREKDSRMMNVRFGYGHHNQRQTRSTGFRVNTAKDLFNLSIKAGKDLIVSDACDPQISHLIPAWYRDRIDAPAFIFLPLVVQGVCIGAFYADRERSGSPISATEHRHLSMLRNQLVLAIKYRQAAR